MYIKVSNNSTIGNIVKQLTNLVQNKQELVEALTNDDLRRSANDFLTLWQAQRPAAITTTTTTTTTKPTTKPTITTTTTTTKPTITTTTSSSSLPSSQRAKKAQPNDVNTNTPQVPETTPQQERRRVSDERGVEKRRRLINSNNNANSNNSSIAETTNEHDNNNDEACINNINNNNNENNNNNSEINNNNNENVAKAQKFIDSIDFTSSDLLNHTATSHLLRSDSVMCIFTFIKNNVGNEAIDQDFVVRNLQRFRNNTLRGATCENNNASIYIEYVRIVLATLLRTKFKCKNHSLNEI